MLKIPEPPESASLKIRLTASTKRELDTYVKYLKSTQPHATPDTVMEAIINKVIPRVGKDAKAYNEFKKTLKNA